jgi:hypothetical protein
MIKIPPRIFDDKGKFIEPADTSGLDAPLLALLDTVRTEYRATQAAEQAFTDACAEVTASANAVTVTKTYHDAHFPPQSFHELWRENFARK